MRDRLARFICSEAVGYEPQMRAPSGVRAQQGPGGVDLGEAVRAGARDLRGPREAGVQPGPPARVEAADTLLAAHEQLTLPNLEAALEAALDITVSEVSLTREQV